MSQKVDEKPKQDDFFQVCRSCLANCCSSARPPLTTRRRAIIQDFLKVNGIAIENPFEKNTYSFPRETEDNLCVFLNKSTKRCRIHLVKPETCVAGPVTFDINLSTGRIEWFLKTKRICPLAGALYRNNEALKIYLESARRELLKLVHDLDAEALRAILKIEEPDTFKIDEEDLNPDVMAKLKPST